MLELVAGLGLAHDHPGVVDAERLAEDPAEGAQVREIARRVGDESVLDLVLAILLAGLGLADDYPVVVNGVDPGAFTAEGAEGGDGAADFGAVLPAGDLAAGR